MTTVVYVLGKGRSGSTLLDAMLGGVDGFVSTGELWRLWDWGLQRGDRCGCGRPIASCPTWQAVLAASFDDSPDVDAVLRDRDATLRWRSVLRALRGPGRRDGPARRWVDTEARVYRGLAEVSGAEVVVDSSKWPIDPVVFGPVGGMQVVVVHLVRDPRAVAFSWTRRKRVGYQTTDAEMRRFSPASSAASWILRNGVAEIARRRSAARWLTVRYEDLVAAPSATLTRIVDAVGGGPRRLPLSDDGAVVLHEHHMIGGNPSKEAVGRVEVRPDDEWTRALPAAQRAVVTAMTLPLLLHYGYPWRVTAP